MCENGLRKTYEIQALKISKWLHQVRFMELILSKNVKWLIYRPRKSYGNNPVKNMKWMVYRPSKIYGTQLLKNWSDQSICQVKLAEDSL